MPYLLTPQSTARISDSVWAAHAPEIGAATAARGFPLVVTTDAVVESGEIDADCETLGEVLAWLSSIERD